MEALKLGVDSSEVRKGQEELRKLGEESKRTERDVDAFAQRAGRAAADITKGILANATAVALIVKSYIDYADALDEMSMRTGIAAQDLAGLEFAAVQSGTSLQKLEQMLGRLSDKAADAAAGSKSAAAVFKAMGVEVETSNGAVKNQEELLLSIAEKFAGYRDGTQKAALAQEIFGRGGRELIPLLNKGAEGIEELKAKYRELGGITADSASRLNEFNDRVAVLHSTTRVATGQFVEGLLPALTQAVATVENLSKSATGFKAAGEVVGSIIAFIADTAARGAGALQALGTAIGATAAAAVMVTKGQFSSALQTMRDMVEEINQLKARVERDIATANALRKQQEAGLVGSAIEDQNDRALRRGGTVAPVVQRVKAAREEVSKELKALLHDYDQFVDHLSAALNPNYKYEEALRKTAATAKAFGLSQDEVNKVLAYLKKTLDEDTKSWDAYEKEVREGALKMQTDLYEASVKSQQEAEKETQALERQLYSLDRWGLAAYDAAIAQAEANKQMAEMSNETSPEYLAQLDRQIAALNRLRDTARDVKLNEHFKKQTQESEAAFKTMFDAVDGYARSAFDSIFESGESVFKKLTDMVKSTLLATLYQLTVRPFVMNIVANVVGAGGGGSAVLGGAQGLGNLFGGSAGGLGGSLGNIFGGLGSAITGLGGNLFGGIGGALGNVAVEGLLAGTVGNFSAGFTALGAGNLLGGIGTLIGGALPIIGIGVMLASALGAFSRKGGPKTGGFAFSGTDLGLDRFFTPNSADSTAQDTANQMLTSFNSTLARLGGKGEGTFAAGFDTDPQGTASNRAVIEAYVNGALAYRYASGDDSLGRDEETLRKTMELESKRAILAALQASELPNEIARILDSVSAATASAEAIDNVVALAAAFQDLVKFIDEADLSKDVAEVLAAARRSSVEQLSYLGSELRRLGDEYDGTVEATQRLTNATGEYYSALVQTLAQVEQLRQNLSDMFGGTRENLILQTLDDPQRYDYYQMMAARARDQLQTASSPEEVERLSRQIDQYINAAFALLTPEEQRAALAEQLRLLDEVRAEADARLVDISETIQTAGEETLASIRTLLSEFVANLASSSDASKRAADSNVESANTNREAAEVNLRAAQTPLVIRIEDSGVSNA